ncbi:I78 family peptidase inhibitor [Parasphingopyxis sp.]|uniref:I78 family peptidase inhibitor n=1 Tax=Parasphingopyxis sp. TaxID=1920299 RepID=UPI00262DEE26|nr:I78 family peptidase inhibitor [Parasphingopyxis sp.]
MHKAIASVAALGLTAACATTSDTPPMAGGGDCNAAPAQALIGETVTQALGANAMQVTGAELLRWIPPNSAVTMDYRPNRLNISYDENSVITDINCG